MRHRIRYEDENVRCVVYNIRCRIRFVTYDIVCGTCDIVGYMRLSFTSYSYVGINEGRLGFARAKKGLGGLLRPTAGA